MKSYLLFIDGNDLLLFANKLCHGLKELVVGVSHQEAGLANSDGANDDHLVFVRIQQTHSGI